MSACSICLEPELREPAACIPCGHTFCHVCITQWIQSQSRLGLHFGPKKCPQCRVSIGGVQKLFLSDQPTAAGSERLQAADTPSYISPWQQLRLCLGYIVSHLCLTFQLLKQVIVKKCQDFTSVMVRVFTQTRQCLQQFQESVRREWDDLNESSRLWVFAVGLLVLAFIVQDIQQERGVYSCVISPMIRLLFDIVHQILGTVAFLFFRSGLVLMNCGLEVAFGVFEIAYAILEMVALVVFDLVCFPWVLLVACVHLLSAIVTGLFGFIQRIVTSCLICLSVCFVVSMLHEEWKTVFRDLALTTADWALGQLPESRAQRRGGWGADRPESESETWQLRLTELVRAALVVIQRELRQREEAAVQQVEDDH